MNVWYQLTRTNALVRARKALAEMASILSYIAGDIGQQAALDYVGPLKKASSGKSVGTGEGQQAGSMRSRWTTVAIRHIQHTRARESLPSLRRVGPRHLSING
jgi:hypothetical protein